MGIFDSLKSYGGKWMPKAVRKFTQEEIAMVNRAQVVDSQYGLSCCFFMKNGSTMYVPMSNDSSKGVGDFIQLADAEIVTLEKTGENDIQRIRA